MYIWIFAILILSTIVQGLVRNTFVKYNRVANARTVSGAEIAQAISDHFGLGVTVGQSKMGTLSDHYDPRTRAINLSPEVFTGRSVSAAAIAAHEMGHALQHHEGFKALQLRNKLFPMVNFSARTWMWMIMLGIFMTSSNLSGMFITIGILLFGFVVLFQLITLPVEFNASSRALSFLREYGIVSEEQMPGAQKVLKYASYTYVLAAIASLAQLFYLLGSRRD